MTTFLDSYFDTLGAMGPATRATDADGRELPLAQAFAWVNDTARDAHATGNTVIFVGNGGSAGIAGHMATDFSKVGGVRAVTFNDASSLTCLGNDLGYDQVFAQPVAMHGRPGDLLVAISSSGRSANILTAVKAARAKKCKVLTLSGFAPDNPLRALGDVNLYVPASAYGFVEITHLALLHAVLDGRQGWPTPA
ncbi:MAG: SIS domain-containing protein [Rhodospirillales bacterium]|nr:SIS domain-containing protein [Rhodospirillales bacterium]